MTHGAGRDASLLGFCRSILEAARAEWGDDFVTESNAPGNPVLRYSETHYAWAATLLGLEFGDDELFDLAASRLEPWDRGGGPMTFFNAMAVCLAAIEMARAGRRHNRLGAALHGLLARAREHETVAFRQWCGNNAYVQQVAVDTVLLPLARGQEVQPSRIRHLVQQLRRFRTPEGFFFDLPRSGNHREPLCPPTYVMKILFLAGVCHELTGSPDLSDIFLEGMDAFLPLLSGEGQASYFGRTDSSPFAAGLTIFNLRKAAASSSSGHGSLEYVQASCRAERYYTTFPRTPAGMLRCNRFADGASLEEFLRSQDEYAYVGQYSLSSCAYALLGARWFPQGEAPSVDVDEVCGEPASAASGDLGIVRLRRPGAELVLRTGSEVTAWDRRYMGPTVLRYARDGILRVGTPAKTVSTDRAVAGARPNSKLGKLYDLLRHRFLAGFEQLDATTVGFVPVLREGTVDYVPTAGRHELVAPDRVRTSHAFVRLHARGWRPCLIQLVDLANALARRPPRRYVPPPLAPDGALRLMRDVSFDDGGCRIVDTFSGDLTGKTLVLSIRSLLPGGVTVLGLERVGESIGWGSEGRYRLENFRGPAVERVVLLLDPGCA